MLRHSVLSPMLFLAVCVFCSASTATDPLWTVDLVPHGFVVDERRSWGSVLPERMIAFSNEDEVVVLNQSFREAYKSTVRAFVLESRSGKLREPVVEWTVQTSSGIFPVSGGRYAVRDEYGTSLYEPGFRKTNLKSSLEAEMVSPNGERLGARDTRSTHWSW